VDRLLNKINFTGVRKAVTVPDQFARRNFEEKISNLWMSSSAVMKVLSLSAKSVRNWKENGHFTVVCSAYRKV